MFKKFLFLATVGIVAATPLFSQTALSVKQAEMACGAENIKFKVDSHNTGHPVAPAVPGKAWVYVIGDVPGHGGFLSLDPTIRVGLDGKWVGADENLSYIFFSVTPGVHHLCIKTQTQHTDLQFLTYLDSFHAEPNRTYYFRIQAKREGGPEKAGVELELNRLNADEANLLLAEYPHSVSSIKR